MHLKRKSTIVLLFGILAISNPVYSHTDIHTDAGILSNIIATGLVVAFIVLFLLVSKRKERKQHDK